MTFTGASHDLDSSFGQGDKRADYASSQSFSHKNFHSRGIHSPAIRAIRYPSNV